jgi:hypothetical protein
MKRSSKNRLMPRHGDLFPDDTLFQGIAREIFRAAVLPRKELYEALETAKTCAAASWEPLISQMHGIGK